MTYCFRTQTRTHKSYTTNKSYSNTIMASASATPVKITSSLSFDKKDVGRFIGGLNKHVRGKTARQVGRAYSDKFAKVSEEEQKKMVPPKDLGFVGVKVNVTDAQDVEAWLTNENVDLSEFNPILEKNIATHSQQFSRPTPVEDRFSHKFGFAVFLYHQGMIGKFLGAGGKNVKKIADEITAVTGLSSCFINIRDASEDHQAKRPFKNRFIQIYQNGDDCPFEATITVSVNLRNGENPDEIMAKITCILVPKILKLGEKPRYFKGPEIIDAVTYLDGLDMEFKDEVVGAQIDWDASNSPRYSPSSPTYSPDEPARFGEAPRKPSWA